MRFLCLSSLSEAVEELKKVGVDPYGIEAMAPKMMNINILIEDIECKIANIIKQEMLSIGGDAAVARGSIDCSIDKTDAIITGTIKQIKKFADKISSQPFGLNRIASDIKKLFDNISKNSFTIRTPKREITLVDHTLIMGIINVTPDSFSDGGLFSTAAEAVEYGVKMVKDGADILDVGGESSRPGSDPVSMEDELNRVIPVIKGLKEKVSVPISIDTTKADIARVAVESGAEIINDISAMRFDEEMPKIAADYGTPVILMHMRGNPKNMQEGDLTYQSLRGKIIDFLKNRIEKAESCGIDTENIIIDPGMGFGKTVEDNIKLLKYLSEFKVLGRPILVGTSRKSFIGKITGEENPIMRTSGTAATVTAAIMNGANIIRIHDIKTMKHVAAMADAIVRG
ncbi:MAG: dihydropteroate synthase [Thermodesulfobacteriota bacterium]|nr:dihydropteroate synthase [Thermodesulfobacteriota bacterium]